MRAVRYAAWALVAAIAAATAWIALSGTGTRDVLQVANARIGGPFELVRADGARITDQDLLGKPHAMFFGFTHCPEVCPTTLYEAAGWLEQLGADADRLAIYFVSVDPERDTPQVLKEYVESFDPRITGITGPLEAVEKTLADYKVYFKKVPTEGGDYTMDHTATMYLMDSKGNFQGTIAWGEDPAVAVEKLRKLIDNG